VGMPVPARGPVGMLEGPVGIRADGGPDGIDGDGLGVGRVTGLVSAAGRLGGAAPHAVVSGRACRSAPNDPLPPRIYEEPRALGL
jgi:hypothetical protein